MSPVTARRNRSMAAMAPLLQRWHAVGERQQRIFMWLALISVSLCLLAFVWLPAMRAHDRMLARLPMLGAQLAKMQSQAAEVRLLAARPATATNTLPAADARALQSIFGEGAKISVEAHRGFRVVIERIDYATWWDRLDDTESRYSLRLVSLALTRMQAGDRNVAVDFVLADRAPANTGGAGKK